MRERQPAETVTAATLSGKERGAIEEFLVYIEDRVKDVEPICANLVRMARLALVEARGSDRSDSTMH